MAAMTAAPAAADPTPAPTAVDDLRAALDLVTADPAARDLLARTGPRPDPDGDLAAWLYRTWWSAATAAVPTPPAAVGDDRSTDGTGPDDPPLTGALDTARRQATRPLPGLLVLAGTADRLLVVPAPHPWHPDPGHSDPRHSDPRHSDPGHQHLEHQDHRHPTGTADRPCLVDTDAVTASSRPGRPPRPGDLVTVLPGSSGVQPGTGWWWARTALDSREDDLPDDVDRIYLHTDATRAPAVVRAVLTALTGHGVPLSLKCPSVASGYHRRDTLVAYHPRTHRRTVDALLPDLLDALTGLLLPGEPPLTRRLAPGAAWAQDPGHGLSYGQLRCAQTAAALARCRPDPARPGPHPDGADPGGTHHDGAGPTRTDDTRTARTTPPTAHVTDAALRRAAVAVGLDPDRPHLVTVTPDGAAASAHPGPDDADAPAVPAARSRTARS